MQKSNQESLLFRIEKFLADLTKKQAIWIIVVIGMIVFANSLFNNFIGDDYTLIVTNTKVHSILNLPSFFASGPFHNIDNSSTGLTGFYYRPLYTTAYSLIYSFFGAWPPAYHLAQLLVHILNAILIFLILRKLLHKKIALGLSLIFLVHPINNESIVNIAALGEPLFMFFGLMALKLTQISSPKSSKDIWIITFLTFTLLSKETGILFLVIVPLYRMLFQFPWRKGLVQSGAALLIYGVFRFIIAGSSLGSGQMPVVPFKDIALLQKLENIPAIIFYYVRTFLYPRDLITFQRWVVKSIDLQSFYYPLIGILVFFFIIMLFGVIIYRKNREQFKMFLFFLTWFILGMGMTLPFIPLDFTVTDRWFYFPVVGLLGILGIVVELLFLNKKLNTFVYATLIVIIVGLFGIRNVVRNTNWADALTLYKHDINYYPNDSFYQSAYGLELFNRGDIEGARYHLEYSISISPTSENLTGLALLDIQLKKFKDAEDLLTQAIAIKESYITYSYLAWLMVQENDPRTTIDLLNKFAEKYPKNDIPWQLLAIQEYRLGNKTDALIAINKANFISPSANTTYIYESIINNRPISINGE